MHIRAFFKIITHEKFFNLLLSTTLNHVKEINFYLFLALYRVYLLNKNKLYLYIWYKNGKIYV